MRKYEAPKMEVIALAKNDVIMTSGIDTPSSDGNVSNPTPED